MKPRLSLIEKTFTLHRLEAAAPIPDVVLDSSFLSITRTSDELSILVPEGVTLSETRQEAGWSCIKVLGPLDFSLTGILAGISGVLAEEGISIFTLSTFDTDYILVKQENCGRARQVLETEGYEFIESD
jgi:hypothetical protein